MDFLLSSDNNYAQHLGVTIYSLLNSNHGVDADAIRIFIVDNGISEENHRKLELMVSSFYDVRLTFIPFEQWREKLHLNLLWPISLSSYARLFMSSMLPNDVDRVVYLDCDMIVCGDLKELWDIDMHGCVVAAVQDYQSDEPKRKIGLEPADCYFNAGMLLVDLKAWRQQKCEDKCMKFIDDHMGNVFHHDQGTLNGVFRGKWLRLPICYNFMTINFFVNAKSLKTFCRDNTLIGYSEDEIIKAKSHPLILHFTPSLTTRPWVKTCKHPLRHLYWENLKQTPWKDAQPEPDKTKWYVRLINWWYRNTL